jgi:hypothetical protein
VIGVATLVGAIAFVLFPLGAHRHRANPAADPR